MKKGLLLVVLLTIAACTSGPAGPDINQPFIGGNTGLNLYLQNGLPPPTVFDGNKGPFSIGVVMENMGEADIGPGTDNPFLHIRLEGLLPSNFGITDADLIQEPPIMIRGATRNFDGTILPGDIHHVIFESLAFQPKLPGNQAHLFRVVACYDYSTTAVTQLCMKDDILESAQDATICTLSGPKPVLNSGGPIQITEVIQNPMGANKIQVTLKVEHTGIGEFYGREAGEICDPSPRNPNKYKVEMTVDSDDPGANVVCYQLGSSNHGTLRMYQGTAQMLTCVIEGSSSVSRVYQTSLNIDLAYRYGQFIESPFTIQAVPE